MKDPYTVLGVPRNASQGEIKKAYRKLAKELHPDLHRGDKSVAERFKKVSAAYELLSDKEQRARYDRGEIDASGAERAGANFRRSYASAGPGADIFADLGFGGFNPEDLFTNLFGGLRGRAHGRGPARARGADRQYTLKVNFLDAATGCRKRLTLPRGKILDVTIPAGIDDGQTIRLKNQGAQGQGGGPQGDALIEVQVEPHPFFTRNGRDIHVEAPVTLPEAVLGGEITVPTIDGAVSLKVPRGSNSGTTLRLKGKGILDRQSGKRGDQYVELKVMLPDRPDPELERRIAEWAKDHDYDVRKKLRMA
ncbi:MAG: DnaJ C-terminal domain-containing protein [Kiloniellales bacterium]